ncbi:SAM-dependent methyltransferase [Chitinivorax tropicus]|uniref:SAM-dependent methyltransferase n=1 Tax=Chitinivorax tropicus TaxID=714531 RepID=A0A840MQU9_9PROT|nr:class I SAM-dependent methyltransferase [Chitinivorax tropicus]MBB5017611.1 SAM-dependent methyltransferase [Chitinivorax tropicus]
MTTTTLADTLASLSQQLTDYLCSHPTDTYRALGIPPTAGLTVEVTESACPITHHEQDGLTCIRIGLEDARRVLAYTHACGWANGVVLIPTLTKLVAAGAFADLKAGEPRGMLAFARQRSSDPTPNLGMLWGALNLIALTGWLILDRGDETAHYQLTPSGACAVAYVEQHRALFNRLASASDMLQHAHALCHGRLQNPAYVALYVDLVQTSQSGWPLRTGTDPISKRVRCQLQTAMDGLLAGPTWIALDMPVFEQRGDRQSKVAPAILEQMSDPLAWVDSTTSWPHASPDFLTAAWQLMHRLGMLERSPDGQQIRLSAEGVIHRPIAAPYAALPASYLRSYAVLEELLFGNPDPLGVAHDRHIDRVMNIYGSSGAGSGPASREISEKIIRRLFNDTPLNRQPAGIADIGCGDGSALKRLAEYIIQHTLRGKHLADYPLLVVGADYNESARSRATDTLAPLSQQADVQVRVLHADIARPDQYNQTLTESGLTVRTQSGALRPAQLSDLVHTFMFLVHNRPLAIRAPEQASSILQQHLDKVDPQRLRKILSQHFSEAYPPASPDATDKPTLEELKGLFRVAYADEQGLVPGYVAAADLIDFIHRWRPYIQHGFLAVEGHSPWAANLVEAAPSNPAHWMRSEQLAAVFNWGMHFLSWQLMMPFNEFQLALCLAGLAPRQDIYGRVHPEGFPGLDLLSEYRFFSIADYIPVDDTTGH